MALSNDKLLCWKFYFLSEHIINVMPENHSLIFRHELVKRVIAALLSPFSTEQNRTEQNRTLMHSTN